MMDFVHARENMVDCQVRTCDVTSHDLLSAMLSVPREAFVPPEKVSLAYTDENMSLASMGGEDRYLMQPASLAKMAQIAKADSKDVALVVGAGTGYSSAVLSLLCSSVVAVESNEALAQFASERLIENDYMNVAVVRADMKSGYAKEAPYDVILIDGAVEILPDKLLDQLAEGGRLVCVFGLGNSAVIRLYEKTDDIISQRDIMNCAVNLIPGFEQEQEFSF